MNKYRKINYAVKALSTLTSIHSHRQTKPQWLTRGAMRRRGATATGLRSTYNGQARGSAVGEDDASSVASSMRSSAASSFTSVSTAGSMTSGTSVGTADTDERGGGGGGHVAAAGDVPMSEADFVAAVQAAQHTIIAATTKNKLLSSREKEERKALSEQLEVKLENKELQRIKTRLELEMGRAGLTLVTCPWSKADSKGRTVPVYAWYRRNKSVQTQSLTPQMLYETVMSITVEKIQEYMAATKRTVPWPEAVVQVVMQTISKNRSDPKAVLTFAAGKYEASKNRDGSKGPDVLVLPGGFRQPEEPTPRIRQYIQEYYRVLRPLTEFDTRFREQRKAIKKGEKDAKFTLDVFMEKNNLSLSDPIPVYYGNDPNEEPTLYVIERYIMKSRSRTTVSVGDCKKTLLEVVNGFVGEFRRRLKGLRRSQQNLDPSLARFNAIDTLQLRMFMKEFREGMVEELKRKYSQPIPPKSNIRARPMTEKDELRLKRGVEAAEAAEEAERAKRAAVGKSRRRLARRAAAGRSEDRGGRGAAAKDGMPPPQARGAIAAKDAWGPSGKARQPPSGGTGRKARRPQAARNSKKRQKT